MGMRILLLALLVLPLMASGVQVSPASGEPESDLRWQQQQWTAHWIGPSEGDTHSFGVWGFRKQFEVSAMPEHFVVHVAADARFRLYVNGTQVAAGPQRSDLWIWRYDSVDLAPWLQTGRNVISAQVWGYGEHAPWSVVSQWTGLIVQGDSDAEQIVNTDASWKVTQLTACSPLPVHVPGYYIAGPGERVDGATMPWGWEGISFDDRNWASPLDQGRGNPYGWGVGVVRGLAPRTIPQMEERPIRFASVRRAIGVTVPEGFLEGGAPLTVQAHSHVSILFDNGCETNAYPQLSVSGGAGAVLRMTYAEALYDSTGNKGNRNDVANKHIEGRADEFIPDGGDHRRFSTLDFRTYRYVQLDIETADKPLQIDDLSGVFTAYPFRENGRFSSDDPELSRIWNVGWRTARLCAYETYMDTPYYEQLQYIGDTRIQALISLYVSGDDRLMRNAIELFDRSRLAEGVTLSRYPVSSPQVIGPFSLYWVDMVHDYWMLRRDDAFVRARLPGVQSALGWFERRVDPDTGLMGPLPYWSFVDWTSQWYWRDELGAGGEPDGVHNGGSAIITLQFAGTLRDASSLFRAYGEVALANRYERLADSLCKAVVTQCWDAKRRMVADTPAKTSFSQHANALAVLSGAIRGDDAADLMRRVSTDLSLVQCSTYFRFYLLRAMKAAGLGDTYIDNLGPWKDMLAQGLTTFAEQPEPTRSDCHAWSASPVYELLATVCGVEPASPGFSRVRVAPHPGYLNHISGVVPHPAGEIRVDLTRSGDAGIVGEVVLPAGVEGEFVWAGTVIPLHTGTQHVSVGAEP